MKKIKNHNRNTKNFKKDASKENLHLAFMMMGITSAIWDDLSFKEKQELENLKKDFNK